MSKEIFEYALKAICPQVGLIKSVNLAIKFNAVLLFYPFV